MSEQITKEQIEYIKSLIKTCGLCGMDSIAIEPDLVRGQADEIERGIFLLQTENVPQDFAFTNLGIGRVKILNNRINLVDEKKMKMSFESKEKDNGDIDVKRLTMVSDKTKIEFSCLETSRIRSPKNIKDKFLYTFEINEDTVKVMAKALSAIEADKISFTNEKDGSVVFKTADSVGDDFTHVIADEYEVSDETDNNSFYFAYKIKYILPLFRAALDSEKKLKVTLSARGFLKTNVNGFNVLVTQEL